MRYLVLVTSLFMIALLIGFSIYQPAGTATIISPTVAAPISATNQLPGCLGCHYGIEDFSDGAMMFAIKGLGAAYGDSGGCVVCHGGTPSATEFNLAHSDAPPALTVLSAFVKLDAPPQTPTGKVDRLALPAPGRGREHRI